jgi:glycosyltransferase involved in cell wall biosynthesis
VIISVVIATRDRAHLLSSTLEALARQEDPGCPWEILVVDNASLAGTPGVVAAAAARTTVPVVYLRETASGKSRALNSAVTHARGSLLVLTDDDVLPAPGWLAAYARAFEDTNADFAAGRIQPLWEASPPRWMSPALYGVLAIPDGGDRRLHLASGTNEHIMPIGANMAIRRHVLERVGGWNPDLGKLQGTLRTGEDHEFALKMLHAGFTGVYEPQALVRHRVPPDRLRLAYFHRWFHDNGVIVAGLEERFPSTAHYLLNVPRYLWRQAAADVLAMARSLGTVDSRRMVAHHMRLAWFAGYLQGRWRRTRNAPFDAEPSAVYRSAP